MTIQIPFGRLLLAVFLATAFVTGAAAAQAKTEAGTTVSNTFTLNYSVGGFSQPQISNSASPTNFTVDRLVDLTVTALDPAVNVAPNSTSNAVRYRVTNLGNDNVAYTFATSNGSTTYTPSNVVITYFIDLDNDGVLDAGETLQTYTAGSASIDIAPDQNVVVIVRSDVPSGTADGSFANLRLTADSLFPVTSVDVTCTPATCAPGTQIVGDSNGNSLTGAAENVLGDGAGPADAPNDGAFSANALLTVVAPTLAAAKTVVVFNTDPGSDAACAALIAASPGNQYSVPGACVQYIININNTGSGVATNLNVADRLPAEVRFLKAELATSSTTGFADDTGVAGTGPVLTQPLAPENCNGTTNCLVNLTDAILSGGENGQIRIWALVR
jgi:uncharacterized repeat protein (TIGR01451 family)